MSAVVFICGACKGRVSSSRRVDLQTAIAHHEAVCPDLQRLAVPTTTVIVPAITTTTTRRTHGS